MQPMNLSSRLAIFPHLMVSVLYRLIILLNWRPGPPEMVAICMYLHIATVRRTTCQLVVLCRL